MLEPSVKHRKFVSELLKGKGPSDAAAQAGFSPGYGAELMHLPQVRGLLDEAMKKAGIDDYLIARKLREGLDAKTPPRKEGGLAYPDQFVRKQFLDVIFKLRGDYAPEKSESTHKTINLTIDMGMLKAFKDTGFLEAKEVEYLEAELVRDNATEITCNNQQASPAGAEGRTQEEGMGEAGSCGRLEQSTS